MVNRIEKKRSEDSNFSIRQIPPALPKQRPYTVTEFTISSSKNKKNKPFFIRPFRKRECCCPTCMEFFKSKEVEREQLEKKYKEHLNMMHTQFFYYKNKMTDIRDKGALVLMNFGGGFLLLAAQYKTFVEYFQKLKVNDLVVVLKIRDFIDELKIQYYDFISDKMKTDSRYVSIVCYHGKGLYDAHTGVAKRMIKQTAISGHDIRTISDLFQVLQKMKDTFVIKIPSNAELPKMNYSQLREGIKKFHQFHYKDSEPDHIFCKVHSNDVEFVVQVSRAIFPKLKSTAVHKHQGHKCSKCH